MAPGALEGITVVELGGFIAGPFAGQLLGDYGARVIKIEAPDGDPMRRWGIQHDGKGLWWPGIARNKESVVLDLKPLPTANSLAQCSGKPMWCLSISHPVGCLRGGWTTTRWCRATRA